MNRLKIVLLAMTLNIVGAAVNIEKIQSALSAYDVYVVRNGTEVVVFTPLDAIFSGQTTFLKEGSGRYINELIGLISQSKGEVKLDALITPSEENQALSSSIAYTQAVELSKVLLQGGGQISYAPLTVKLQERNNSYGFWQRYPSQSRFIQMSLSVD